MAIGVLEALFAGKLSRRPGDAGRGGLTMRRALLIAVIVAVAALGGVWAASAVAPCAMPPALMAKIAPGKIGSCPAPRAADQPRAVEPPAVTVVPAVRREFVDRLFVSGTLVAREEAQVVARIDGLTIVEVDAEDGDSVKQGQVLARLDRTQLDALLAENDAATKRADAAIDQAQSMIAQSEAQLQFASNDFDRARKLTGGVMSVSTIEQRETAMKTAQAQLAAATHALSVARGRSQEPRRRAAGAPGAHRPDGGQGACRRDRQPAVGQGRRGRVDHRRAAVPHHPGRGDRSRGRRARAVAGRTRSSASRRN